MPRAVDFLPQYIMQLMNLLASIEPKRGSVFSCVSLAVILLIVLNAFANFQLCVNFVWRLQTELVGSLEIVRSQYRLAITDFLHRSGYGLGGAHRHREYRVSHES